MVFATLALLAQEVVVVEDPDQGRFIPSITFTGRLSFPSGSLTDGDIWYSDNFDDGWGFSVEVGLHRGVGPGEVDRHRVVGAGDRGGGVGWGRGYGGAQRVASTADSGEFVGLRGKLLV